MANSDKADLVTLAQEGNLPELKRQIAQGENIEQRDIKLRTPLMAATHANQIEVATPLEELYILYNKVVQLIDNTGATIIHPLVGRYATSMEMTGASLTFCKLDDELEALLNAPAHCAFWRV